MLASYVVADLVRNPRRTLATMVGVMLGVGLFCAVLFFVDGLSASMTQRAVEPLAIDMQRVVTARVGGSLELTQDFDPAGPMAAGTSTTVTITVTNTSRVAANEVTIRSVPAAGLSAVARSAMLDGLTIDSDDPNPLASGSGQVGLNIGTVEPGDAHVLTYLVEATSDTDIGDVAVASSYSSRESVAPVAANTLASVSLDELATLVSAIDGVEAAAPLSLADLGTDALSTATAVASGPTRIFGFDADYAHRDPTIDIVEGALTNGGALISVEAAGALALGIGDTVAVELPDRSSLRLDITGLADLTRSRSLFSSRRGGDLETFIYAANSVVVSAAQFESVVLPAYERAATARGGRLKSPPIREIDVNVDRELLASDPEAAVGQTRRIAEEVTAVASHQDYLLDNISNTLQVATADARVAKRLFVFLGLPGALLAAMLAAYSGAVLADAQRREQAMLRVRGASRNHLLRMLAMRTWVLTSIGALVGLCVGYLAAAAVLGRESVDRAGTGSLIRSAAIGTLGGLVATGLALYVTGRRSIDREINEDRAQLVHRPPIWRRARLDVIGVAGVVVGTTIALRAKAFDGAAGSVYFGRSVELNLALLALPLAVWISGSLFAARCFGTLLDRSQPASTSAIRRPFASLYRLSIGRRPWAIANASVIVSLIVALAVCLAGFTASYDAAKVDDARFANGADIRITPSPTAERTYGAGDSAVFELDGIEQATPVIYGLSNVILRSARTSDPANLAAVDPIGYLAVAPVADGDFPSGSAQSSFEALAAEPGAILLSADMASFLKAEVGDDIDVLLARATDGQVDVRLQIAGLFERLPGFPEGADAVMSVHSHVGHVPDKAPDFFLASPGPGDDGLDRGEVALRTADGVGSAVRIDTRTSALSRDQSSLAALNIAGLVDLDSAFSLSMAVVTISIFVFGLLLQRRREYVTLRAQGLESRVIRLLIAAEAGTVAVIGVGAGLVVGAAMGYFFVTVLRPLFVLTPRYHLPLAQMAIPIGLVFAATGASALVASRLVDRLDPTELLRDE